MSKNYLRVWGAVCAGLMLGQGMSGQVAYDVLPAEPTWLPFVIDSNSATFWRNGTLRVFSSAGTPMMNRLDSQFRHLGTQPVAVDRKDHFPMWIESVWEAGDGALYGWYHYERIGVCPNSNLSVPEIGALVSYDGGRRFQDLGIVLSSGEAVNCSAKNSFFAGGHGDFSVIPDSRNEYLYFLFGAYGGDMSGQGVAIARMLVGDARKPTGAVWKYNQGAWSEPGIGGRVTPIFPATVSWADEDTDSFWGPSIHWNSYLERYVVLMNRSCCAPGWPQAGVYLTTNADLDNPDGRRRRRFSIMATGIPGSWVPMRATPARKQGSGFACLFARVRSGRLCSGRSPPRRLHPTFHLRLPPSLLRPRMASRSLLLQGNLRAPCR